MYNWDDIVIVGDSFCANRTDKLSWPQLLTCNLTGTEYNANTQPRGQGFPGGAWWAYRQTLISELAVKVPKVLIIFHTEPYRLPNDNNLSINYRSVETKMLSFPGKETTMPRKLAEAAALYYQELICTPFCEWANTQWYAELEKLIEPIEKVIHLHCFNMTADHVFSKGVTITYPLSDYVDKKKSFLGFNSKIMNHYSVAGNKLFAESIIDLVNNYPADGTNLNIKLVNHADR